MTTPEEIIKKIAIEYVKKNRGKLIDKFGNKDKYKPSKHPVSFFMAGSPGAGKTEFSKSYIPLLENDIDERIIRIDADEIRDILPNYSGSNSYLFQEAASTGVSKIYDYALRKKINILVDGTFSSEKYALENIKRSLDKEREVVIIYIYQDPIQSWEFTQAREKLEGRHISLEVFIASFFKARNNINKMKKIFGNKIRVDLIKKDHNHAIEKTWQNIKNDINKYTPTEYTTSTLFNTLKKINI